MTDGVNVSHDLLLSWPIAVAIVLVIAAAFGTAGYLIAVRRFKQPLVIFAAY